jgi:hypothetical protein
MMMKILVGFQLGKVTIYKLAETIILDYGTEKNFQNKKTNTCRI